MVVHNAETTVNSLNYVILCKETIYLFIIHPGKDKTSLLKGLRAPEDFTNYFGEGPLHFWILGSSVGNFEHTMLWDTYSNLKI